jgi:tetratricopeptide (TPR) repeat protein
MMAIGHLRWPFELIIRQINFKQMKNKALFLLLSLSSSYAFSQAIRIPQFKNFDCSVGRKVATTQINVSYSAPQVKGRTGRIWGTDVAWFGTIVLGYGSDVASPWRAGADEATVVSFSTDVNVNGQPLKAGKYALFMELQADETMLIFNSNTREWGSYFYDKNRDVLRVKTKQIKNAPFAEVLEYRFDSQTDSTVSLSLNWENWSIPMTISVNATDNVFAYIQDEMSSELGFDRPSLKQAARWCLSNNKGLEKAVGWLDRAGNPSFGGLEDFELLDLKSDLLTKLGKTEDAKAARTKSISVATAYELHIYARRLGQQGRKAEAIELFEQNFKKHNGVWPTKVGMMRASSLKGELPKALEFAKKALTEAPDEINRRALEAAIKTLSDGKSL